MISGLIILERCRVESDLESTCRNSFKLCKKGGREGGRGGERERERGEKEALS